MNYDRIRRRGLKKVSCEIMLMCLGRNIRKFFSLINNSEIKNNYWDKKNDLKKEKFPFPKQKSKKKRTA